MVPLIVLMTISIAYIVLYFADNTLFHRSFELFLSLVIQIAPFLLIIFVIMFINFWFIKPDFIKKHLGEQAGLKGITFVILSGIISVGSVYVWYPLLKDLKESGMSNKLIAIFIYNRSIKLHLLPVMILYFGLTFTMVLSLLTILFSLVIGYLVQLFTSENLSLIGDRFQTAGVNNLHHVHLWQMDEHNLHFEARDPIGSAI